MNNDTPQQHPDTKDTSELDDVLNGDELHLLIFKRLETMLDNSDEFGLYQTSDFMIGLKKDLEALIDRRCAAELEALKRKRDVLLGSREEFVYLADIDEAIARLQQGSGQAGQLATPVDAQALGHEADNWGETAHPREEQ